MEEELEAFNERLINWRRVYGDSTSHYRSPTLIFCQYAKATMERKHETESERYWREVSEIAARGETPPPPDYADAELLNDVWSRMPETYCTLPIKIIIREYVFSSFGTFNRLLDSFKIYGDQRIIWVKRCLKEFKNRVDREERIRREFDF